MILLPVLAFAVSLAVTWGMSVHLTPDVSLYTGSGVGLYPSPLGTLVGHFGGYLGLALVQALALALLVLVFVRARVEPAALVLGLPVLWWVLPLGVDVVALLLLVLALVSGRWWLSLIAGAFHLAAFPVAAAGYARRSLPLAGGLAAAGFAALWLTPYGAALPGRNGLLLVFGLPAAAVVMLLALAPVLVGGSPPVPVLLGTGAVVLYATTAHVESGEGFALSVFGAMRYALPLTVCTALSCRAEVRWANGAAYDGPGERTVMRLKTFALSVAVAALGALVLASTALAVTVPAVPVSAYGDSLLSSLATAIGTIFPYAAAITAFAIGVGMVKRWLGHRKATRV